jgi:hypothetical protein
MKALIPVSPKKIGHYNGCKMDYPKTTTSISTTQTILRAKYAESQLKYLHILRNNTY